jgi:hypothetical protein
MEQATVTESSSGGSPHFQDFVSLRDRDLQVSFSHFYLSVVSCVTEGSQRRTFMGGHQHLLSLE